MKSCRHAALGGLLPARLVVEPADVAGADVLADEELVAHEVLEDDADPPPQRFRIPLAQVEAVEHDAPRRRLVEPGERA